MINNFSISNCLEYLQIIYLNDAENGLPSLAIKGSFLLLPSIIPLECVFYILNKYSANWRPKNTAAWKQQMFKMRATNKNVAPVFIAVILIFFYSSSYSSQCLYVLKPLWCDSQWAAKMIYHHKCAILSDFRIFLPLQSKSGCLMDLVLGVTRTYMLEWSHFSIYFLSPSISFSV